MLAIVTGFDAFGGEPVNPSAAAITWLPARLGGLDLVTCCLPTSYERAPALLLDQVRAHRPDIVLSVGQAGGRPVPTLERVAINLADLRDPDNDGITLSERPIVEGGPAGYFSTLPLVPAVAALHRAGLTAAISLSAGTFVCNTVLYRLLHEFPRADALLAGFLHLPYLPEQAADHAGAPSMALDSMVRTIEIVLETAAKLR
jgi:pyroglutamyl-peptidase